jgi:hypothetical protein
MELRSTDLIYRSSSLKTIADNLLRLCPLTSELQGKADHRGWSELSSLAENPSIAALQNVVQAFLADKLITTAPLQEFLANTADQISIDTYFVASQIAIEQKESYPVGSFLLAYLSMMGWIYKLGTTAIYASDEGLPNPGWGTIPFACAYTLTCELVDGYWVAKQIVTEAKNILSMTKVKTSYIPGIETAKNKYRELDLEISKKLNECMKELACDIRKACCTNEINWRSEIGAILWTLGQVPDSALFKHSTVSSYLPSQQFFRRLVKSSLLAIPTDPLLQYIWLELKDRPPINLREHRVLFAVINARYNHPRLESGFPVSMAEVYAHTIIELFRGTLDDYTVQTFYENFNPFSQTGDITDASADFRIATLGIELSRSECGAGQRLRSLFAEHSEQMMAVSMKFACNMLEESVMYPEWPNVNNFANAFLHELIESKLSLIESSFDPEILMECVTAVEKLRAAALSYWLMITPPLPRMDDPAALEDLINEDSHLRLILRSAYFLARWNSFPEHYRLFSISIHGASNPIQAAQDQLGVPTDSETGRKRYRRAQQDLLNLIKRMEDVSPRYADRRGNPVPSASRIFEQLNSHRFLQN